MAKMEILRAVPIAHIVYLLQEEQEFSLAYSLLRDWRGEDCLSDEEIVYIFENVVAAGRVPEAKALIEADNGWIQRLNTGFNVNELE